MKLATAQNPIELSMSLATDSYSLCKTVGKTGPPSWSPGSNPWLAGSGIVWGFGSYTTSAIRSWMHWRLRTGRGARLTPAPAKFEPW